ncbi:MAG: hypothetical protein OEY52_10310 [Gammaproteobacteria bacterium]|nr:hypothetical protein [Gammaproteobacteria bacterium]
MKYIASLLLIIITPHSYAESERLLEGHWLGGGSAFWEHDFTIKDNIISFNSVSCLNNKFEIIENFKGQLPNFIEGNDDYFTFVIKINFGDTRDCKIAKYRTGEYLRINIYQKNTCKSSINLYSNFDEMMKDKKDNWNNKVGSWGIWKQDFGTRNCNPYLTNQ